MFGRPRQLPYPPTPATTPGSTRAVSGASARPKRRESMTAIGRAPMVRMSRTMPPTPVAALVGLHVARVVVRLDLEGDRVAVADVDHPRVLADADEQRVTVREVTELAQMHLGALVGAVLAPHDGVHREFGGGRAAAEDALDAGVLVVLESELAIGLPVVRGLLGSLYGVDHAATAAFSTLVKKPSPSVDGPVRSSTACSGCGISPTTRPFSLHTPAMSRLEPFGLPSV